MKRLQPVVWSKGTALLPQHLQNQDRFFEGSLQFRVNALTFRPWGFHTLELDHGALASGSFALLRASGILPDGLLFDIPDSDDGPAAKPLAGTFDEDADTLDMYLAIPEWKERGVNVAGSLDSNTRFQAETALLRDETTGLTERPVQVARKNFRLLTAQELREGFAALRVARIKRTPSGDYASDPALLPPLLDIQAGPALASLLRRLVEVLSARSTMLGEGRRHKNELLADFTASDIPNFWLLYTINSHLPRLTHLLHAKRSHPESVFAAMLALAGALTTFSRDIHPRDLPVYEHDDGGQCFATLDAQLRTLLETVVPSNFVALPLKRIQPSIYGTALDDEKYLSGAAMYLAVQADIGAAELIAKVPALIKLCSANHIEHLVRHALPGVPLLHLAAPPSALPLKLNYKYFSLNQSGVAWEAITRARNFAAWVPDDFPNPQLELVIVLSSRD